MIPDEESKAVAGSAASGQGKGRRRSRRGGRRHSRRRGPRPPEGESAETATDERADVSARAEEMDAAPESVSEPVAEEAAPPASSKPASITDAIDQVTGIIDELKHVLDEMEEVLETLELAERQKIDDEREIDSLQRALRQLHRGGSDRSSRR